MEVYAPIRLNGSDVVGAYEIYHDLTVVSARIGEMQRFVWLSVGGAFALLYLALFGLVRRASGEMRRQTEELGRLETHRELSRVRREFVNIVSHELRTPLTTLLGFTELLLTRDVAVDQQRSWTEVLHSEAKRLSELVDEVLDVSRLEEGRVRIRPRIVDIRDVVTRAIRTLQAIPGHERLVPFYDDGLPHVTADPDKMMQVFVNLMSNAIKYSPNDDSIFIHVFFDGPAVQVKVIDSGLGIPAEALPRLFERFYRVSDGEHLEIKGTGLGLYISRQLVELHGGKIWAESAGAGHGSTFRIAIPAARVEQPPAPPMRVAAAA